jgi:hypothetical protein
MQLTTTIRKPHLRDFLPSIKSILESLRPDDAISEELLELIGYEDIDLVSELLQSRSSVATLVRLLLRLVRHSSCLLSKLSCFRLLSRSLKMYLLWQLLVS